MIILEWLILGLTSGKLYSAEIKESREIREKRIIEKKSQKVISRKGKVDRKIDYIDAVDYWRYGWKIYNSDELKENKEMRKKRLLKEKS